ncbi:hypothetical protein Barb6_02224 [Bacteroidales bacterium Barb6]|nr:hypothetical protein Barb6_02224 [Bacteroidales bacterium Barb6]
MSRPYAWRAGFLILYGMAWLVSDIISFAVILAIGYFDNPLIEWVYKNDKSTLRFALVIFPLYLITNLTARILLYVLFQWI